LSIISSARKEILASLNTDKTDKCAFLHGAFRGLGYFSLSSTGITMVMETSDLELIQKCADIVNDLTSEYPQIIKKTTSAKAKIPTYGLKISKEKTSKLLVDLGFGQDEIPSLSNRIDFSFFGNEIKMKSLLKGLFLATGTLSAPANARNAKSSGYHLEMRICSETLALDLITLLSKFNIIAKTRARNNFYTIYIKDAEIISDFLAATDAFQTLFKLQDLIMVRSVSNDSNRGTNCNVANINKAIDASAKQTHAIKVLQKHKKFNDLEPNLRLTATLRLEHPELTLMELANMIGVSKSCINHRMRKILSLADELETK
jgi:hypothetical protein